MTDTTTTPNEAEAVTEQALGELEHLDPNDLQVGDNIREYANLNKPFLDSIAEHGVLVPLTAIRRPDGVVEGNSIQLRRGDIDINDEVIRLRRAAAKVTGAKDGHIIGEPKSRAGIRNISIPPHLLVTVEDHLTKHVAPQCDALLFPSIPGGTHHLIPCC